MNAEITPAERFYDRLMMGDSAPDPELFERAYSFRDWAHDNPLAALAWRPRFLRVRDNPATAHLWAAVKDMIERAPAAAPLATASPAARLQAPSTAPAPAPIQIAHKAGAAEAAHVIAEEYRTWREAHLTDSALREISQFAPIKVQEARGLEATANGTQDPATRRALLRQAGRIWSALLNCKEPSL